VIVRLGEQGHDGVTDIGNEAGASWVNKPNPVGIHQIRPLIFDPDANVATSHKINGRWYRSSLHMGRIPP
jgi:hypothetical protein